MSKNNVFERAKTAYDYIFGRGDYEYKQELIPSVVGQIDDGGYDVWSNNTRVVLAPVINQIALDAAGVAIRHVTTDEYGNFIKPRRSELNDRLKVAPNLDQTPGGFFRELYTRVLNEGAAAIVPTATSSNPAFGSYEIYSMRVGQITDWFTDSVELLVYNVLTGERERKVVSKRHVAIIFNPFAMVMNHPNGTLRRYSEKLGILDNSDSRLSGGRNLDLIVQLPYRVHSERRKKDAQNRSIEITKQLSGSDYGIGYMGATEKIVQLNRPVVDNLPGRVEYLEKRLYNQLGITQSIFDGTATEEEYIVYRRRTLLPIIKETVDAMRRVFLTKTARTQHQDIRYFVDVFGLATLETLSEAADKFGRNEIMTSNEFRGIMGLPRSEEEGADELRNKNLNEQKDAPPAPTGSAPTDGEKIEPAEEVKDDKKK